MKIKHSVFSAVVNSYFKTSAALNVKLKKGALMSGKLICKKHFGLTAAFGWEGDRHAPIAFIDGSFLLRDRGNTLVTFGFCEGDYDDKIMWYNSEGFLPCFISEFCKGKVNYRIENFADKVTVDGRDFEAVYSRLTVDNGSDSDVALPKRSKLLIPLGEDINTVKAGAKIRLEFVVGADRFGEKYRYPVAQKLKALGGFNEHYKHMKNYWLERMEPLAEITELPDEKLINAYKAGYIYTQIIKDGTELHVGENGYDRVFDHDVIGIMAYLLTIGDFVNFKEYAKHILLNVQYPDARWKYSWVFAMYLMRTDDTEYIMSQFADIKSNTHAIEADRVDENGIMKRTNAIDSNGFWTTDNWSALMGLASYKYICERIGYESEAVWAKNQYDSLLAASNKKLEETLEKCSINYIPMSVEEPNETCDRNDPRDANWASMFLFGRWAWDGYLFGADQHGVMFDLIDETYSHGFERRRDISDTIYNFGGYPHGYFSSSYNAGYGSAALRGKKYRDAGIKAYQFMINRSQSGPFGWWEGIGYPEESSPWEIPHAATGGGSCQHMWGQATATKVLFDSLIAERSDGTIIIGRGIPEEWKRKGETIAVRDYPVSQNRKISFRIVYGQDSVKLTVSGDISRVKILPDFIDIESVKKVKNCDGMRLNGEHIEVSENMISAQLEISHKN